MRTAPNNVAGFDIGGTSVKMWFRNRESVYATGDLANCAQQELLDFLKHRMPRAKRLDALGIALPCTFLTENGIRRILPTCSKFGQLSTESHGGVVQALEKSWYRQLSVRVFVTDDAEAACFEAMTILKRIHKASFRHILVVTLGTSIGVGLVLNSEPYHGTFTSRASHMLMDPDGAWCANDVHKGCWKSLAGSEARSILAASMGLQGDVETIAHEAAKGSKKAQLFFSYYADNIARGLALILNAVPVDCVVIAGGVAKARDSLFDPLISRLRRGDLIDADLVRLIDIVHVPYFSVARGAHTYAVRRLISEAT